MFWDFQREKYTFFQKCSKNGLVAKKMIITFFLNPSLIDKISEVQLFENKLYDYEKVRFTNVFVSRALFQTGGEGSRKFRPEAEILWIFSIEVAPNAKGLNF